jgi:hypothetical protein
MVGRTWRFRETKREREKCFSAIYRLDLLLLGGMTISRTQMSGDITIPTPELVISAGMGYPLGKTHILFP